jgi:competence protein ComGC
MPSRPAAFTLVELLVVITIIVTVMALLVPAMDQAVYRAELALCATRLKAHATTATVYAMDHKRRYLDRAAMRSSLRIFRPDYLALTMEGPINGQELDDRPALRNYGSINKMFNCPFVDEIDYDGFPPEGNVLDPILLYTSVNYWYGWQYSGTPGLKGMMKIGDRVEWQLPGDEKRHTFSVLVSDIESEDLQDNWTNSAHPDREGFLALTTVRNGLQIFVQGYCAYSYWGQWGSPPNRGTVEQSYAFEDGSVRTLFDIAREDPRVEIVPGYMSTADLVKCRTRLVRN